MIICEVKSEKEERNIYLASYQFDRALKSPSMVIFLDWAVSGLIHNGFMGNVKKGVAAYIFHLIPFDSAGDGIFLYCFRGANSLPRVKISDLYLQL